MDMSVNNVERGSKITFKGVEVTGPKGTKEVEISGDKVEKTPEDSFWQGVGKGIARAIVGGAYPVITGTLKAAEGYENAKEAAKDVGLNEWGIAKAGLKGALVGGIKGFAHGLLDTAAIGALVALGGVLGGPLGAVLAATVGAGFYNLAKDAIRAND